MNDRDIWDVNFKCWMDDKCGSCLCMEGTVAVFGNNIFEALQTAEFVIEGFKFDHYQIDGGKRFPRKEDKNDN